ncbi:MAG: endonuclease/exonuclease/phosphatase family protein [Flavicella sp.]
MLYKHSVLFLFMSVMISFTANSQNKDSLSIYSYNVLYGFNHGTAEKEAVNWFQKKKPDVIAFQELKGYTKNKFELLAKRWKHEYSYLWKRARSSQPIAISSNAPIISVKEVKKQKSDRGYLIAETHDIHFIIVHLHPNNRKKREQEFQSILQSCDSLKKLKKDFCVLGDFNAMLLSDKNYADTNLKTRLKSRIEKGKCADLNPSCSNWDYSVLQEIIPYNWLDVIGLHLTDKTTYIQEQRYGTFPSTASKNIPSKEIRNQHLHRLDHIFIDSNIAHLVIDAQIHQEAQQEIISDHYPVSFRILK